MKSKKINIGLKFNKETVANLNDSDMIGVRGGSVATVEITRCATNCLCDTSICSDFASCPPTLTCSKWDC